VSSAFSLCKEEILRKAPQRNEASELGGGNICSRREGDKALEHLKELKTHEFDI
jgi:hypothetical protein